MSSTGSKRNRFSRRLEAAYRKGFEDGKSTSVPSTEAERVPTEPVVALKALKAWEAWEAKLILEGSDRLWEELGDLTDLQALRNAVEAALSTDAEPVKALPTAIASLERHLLEAIEEHGSSPLFSWIEKDMRDIRAALYAEPVKTAPAVAVKALRWRKYGNQHGTGWQGMGAIGYLQYVVDRGPDGEEGWFWEKRGFDTEDEAKAAVQTDYEARILSALSAHVQDVAGWQSMDNAPKDGSEFVAGRRYATDGEFVVHTYKWVGEPNYWSSKRNGVCIRPQYQDDFLWCPLPASPASKHGDAE